MNSQQLTDYVRTQATIVWAHTGEPFQLSAACVIVNLMRGLPPSDDLGELIAQQFEKEDPCEFP